MLGLMTSIVFLFVWVDTIDRYQWEAQVIELSQQAYQSGLINRPSQSGLRKTRRIGFSLYIHLIYPA